MKILGREITITKATQKVPLPAVNQPKTTITDRTLTSPSMQVLPANSGTTPFASQVINNPGTVTWQGGNAQEQVTLGYSGNDIVYSIIRLIVDKVKQAPWFEYEIQDEVSFKHYNAIMQRPDLVQDWKKVKELHQKALKVATVKTRMSDILDRPNREDCWSDIVEGYSIFKLATGNAYVYGKQIPVGNNAKQPLEIYNLPSQYMSILADLNTFPITPKSYQLYMQYYEWFPYEEILHDKYFNPNWSIVGIQLYGFSPLQAAAKVLTRSNEGKQAAVSNYQNGGPKGMLFVADDKYDPNQTVQEAIDIKKQLARNQGSKNVNQIETSGYKVGYVPLGLSPVDLDLLNAENMDLRALCNIYGVPSQLLNDPDNKTYNNTRDGEKALTVRCAIPMLKSISDQFNRKFQSDWGFKGQKRVIAPDLTVFKELEEDKATQVDWVNKAPLTLRRKLFILNEPTEGYTDEQLNTVLMPSGTTTLEDVMGGKPVNVPDNLNDYNQ